MTFGLIAFAVSFLLPLAWMALTSSSYVRSLNDNSVRHAGERVEQQGLGAVVTTLPLPAQASEQKLAA